MNYLQLCVEAAREARVAGKPATTQNQVGLMADLVQWVADAWTEIQGEKAWTFLHGTKTVTLQVGVQSYNIFGTAPGQLAWTDLRAIDEHSKVICTKTDGSKFFVNFLPWSAWRERYGLVLTWANGAPDIFTWTPDDLLLFNAIPDDAHAIEFPYWKTAQVLALDADTPRGIRPDVHKIIAWRAAKKLCAAKEAFGLATRCMEAENPLYHQLMQSYLPAVEVGPCPFTRSDTESGVRTGKPW